MKLDIKNLTFSYGSKRVLDDISIQFEPMVTAIIGPNATGKSTLLKCISGILKKREGTISIDGRDVRDIGREEVSKNMSYLPQESPTRAVLTVFEAVLLGRHSSLSWRMNREDLDMALEVMEYLGIDDLASRHLNELSGGQQQIVSIAQSLVRNPLILLMDEPTSSLDLQRQLETFDIIRGITLERRITTIVALHDLNLAARYADNIVVLNGGVVYATGNPASVLTPEMIRSVYKVNAKVAIDEDGIPIITPINSVRYNPHIHLLNNNQKFLAMVR